MANILKREKPFRYGFGNPPINSALAAVRASIIADSKKPAE